MGRNAIHFMGSIAKIAKRVGGDLGLPKWQSIGHLIAVLLLCVIGVTPAAAAKPQKEALADQVKKAIDHGRKFLRDEQTAGGDWEKDVNSKTRHGGWTSLALLALLNAGENPKSDVIQKGLRFLRSVEPNDTYVVGLQTMVFAEAGFVEDRVRIQRNVDWLVKMRVMRGNDLQGWGYPDRVGNKSADNSNTQYALLGLWAGKSGGATINRAVWESIRDFYVGTQDMSGGWKYITSEEKIRFTMSTAGLCGLLIAGQELSSDQQKLQKNGVALNCGIYEENKAVARAMDWFTRNFKLEVPQTTFYNIYGIERAGRLTGQRFFGDHDWYREGCEYLVRGQQDDGSWYHRGQLFDTWPIISTSFSLLFLSKGRTPILISKLVHGSPDNPSLDWNRKHNEVRNLTEQASKQLFQRQPLGWQVFNAREVRPTNDDQIRDLVGELLPSPIVWFNGHNRPFFTEWEKKMLRQYVEQGGFILAEACCGSKQFDAGFRDLMTELFGRDAQLKLLTANHPIWRAHVPPVDPREFKLEGLELGCKTVVVYSPEPISGWWEANQFSEGRGKQVFQLGVSIIAYATGLEMPKPKGFHVDVPKSQEDSKIPRGYLKVAQVKQGDHNYRSAANGIRNLMLDLRKNARMDVALKSQEVYCDDKDLLNFKFMYMHGRDEFEVKNVAILKANLETGGLLFADACCGKKDFDKAFRELVKQLFNKPLEPIPANDDLFSRQLNGAEITTVRCRRERKEGEGAGAEAGFAAVQPELEGIKIGNRWVIIYSKYDIGCALEKHQSSDCLGHDYESAVKLASAVVLYALQR
jgi:hypothetical protein